MVSSFWACPWVLGKPSRIKPFLHAGVAKFDFIKSQTISSDTNPPLAIKFFTLFPNSLNQRLK